MATSYWASIATKRVKRRRMLGIASGTSLGAILLAACGGDDDDAPAAGPTSTSTTGGGATGSTGGGATGSTGATSTGATGATGATGGTPSLVTDSVDTTDQAVRGGTIKQYITGEPQSLDPITPISVLNTFAAYVYGTLINEVPGYLGPSKGELTGDFAESWEVSPDRLQITMKMRPGVKWHNKAPVNGREADIEDVLFSWNRYTQLSPVASLSYNGRNPAAPILSAEATDASTVVFKLSEPLSYALHYLAAFGSFTGNMVMMPKEADGGFDPKNEMIGHGPFQLAEATPSVGFTFTRHEGYYDDDAALLGEIEVPIVTEYVQRLAQLKAGNIHRIVFDFALSQDLLSTKNEQKDLLIYQTALAPSFTAFLFGWLPAGESVFQDERLRQAISMGLDRDTLNDAAYNVSRLQDGGLPVETRWNSHVIANWDDYWLDPQGSEFGENAKYFQYNVEEAKKLIEAAGYPDGFTITSNYTVDPRFNQSRTAEPINGMVSDLGINVEINNPDYVNVYIPGIRDGKGQFEGYAFATVLGTLPQVIHPVASPVAEYWPQGGTAFRGFSANGSNDLSGDPELSALLEKARFEVDTDALKSQLNDIQRYLAKSMWGMLGPGGATGFNMAWPAVKNHRVWRRHRQGNASEWDPYAVWVDETLPPFT